MSENLKEKLLKEVQKTGYPLELKVGDIFSKRDWGLQYCRYYLDKDEHKGKEIDISAFKRVFTETVHVGLHIICEVKKSSDKPWVIFSTVKEPLDVPGWNRLHYCHNVDSSILPYEELEKNSSIGKFSRVGRSYYEAFKSADDRSQIFKALTSSVKASEDCLERNKKYFETGFKYSKEIYFIDPVVIFDGFLYEAYLNSKNDLEINEINYIPVSFGYISSEYSRFGYSVEVVRLDELNNLLESKEKWIIGIRNAIMNNPSK